MSLRERSANASLAPSMGKAPAPCRALPRSPGGADGGEEVSGEQLAAATAAAPASSAAGACRTGESLRSLVARESRHELVALVGRELSMNWSNFNRLKREVDASAPVMVVSFLGDTAVGKSTTIAALMASEDDRPHVQRGRDQTASTTCNVNLYSSAALGEGLAVNFLDFEGESGSETPLMGGGGGSGGSSLAGAASSAMGGVRSQTARLFGLAGGVMEGASRASPLARAEAVREFFPKLAYCMSDVIVLIGTEPFFSSCVSGCAGVENKGGQREISCTRRAAPCAPRASATSPPSRPPSTQALPGACHQLCEARQCGRGGCRPACPRAAVQQARAG